MSRFVSFSTHRMDLGVGEHGPEWLEIRDNLSYYERQRLNSSMFDIQISEDAERSMKADLGKYRPAILEAWIVGWQIFADDGKLVPFSREALARLDEITCQVAVDHIDEWERAADEIKKAKGTVPFAILI